MATRNFGRLAGAAFFSAVDNHLEKKRDTRIVAKKLFGPSLRRPKDQCADSEESEEGIFALHPALLEAGMRLAEKPDIQLAVAEVMAQMQLEGVGVTPMQADMKALDAIPVSLPAASSSKKDGGPSIVVVESTLQPQKKRTHKKRSSGKASHAKSSKPAASAGTVMRVVNWILGMLQKIPIAGPAITQSQPAESKRSPRSKPEQHTSEPGTLDGPTSDSDEVCSQPGLEVPNSAHTKADAQPVAAASSTAEFGKIALGIATLLVAMTVLYRNRPSVFTSVTARLRAPAKVDA